MREQEHRHHQQQGGCGGKRFARGHRRPLVASVGSDDGGLRPDIDKLRGAAIGAAAAAAGGAALVTCRHISAPRQDRLAPDKR